MTPTPVTKCLSYVYFEVGRQKLSDVGKQWGIFENETIIAVQLQVNDFDDLGLASKCFAINLVNCDQFEPIE